MRLDLRFGIQTHLVNVNQSNLKAISIVIVVLFSGFLFFIPSHYYSDLLDSLRNGDIVTVYYRPLSTNPIDIDVFQVEKNGKKIVDYADYSKNHATASSALVVIGSVCLLFGILAIWMKTQIRQR